MSDQSSRRWLPLFLRLACCVVVLYAGTPARAGEEATANQPNKSAVARKRLEIMASRIESIVVSSTDPAVPKQMQSTPLFRYDDETRGYVDGTIWRLGEKGRPLAIITAELHPKYLGGGSRVIYDFLSLTERPFTARSLDVAGWSPGSSAVGLKSLAALLHRRTSRPSDSRNSNSRPAAFRGRRSYRSWTRRPCNYGSCRERSTGTHQRRMSWPTGRFFCSSTVATRHCS